MWHGYYVDISPKYASFQSFGSLGAIQRKDGNLGAKLYFFLPNINTLKIYIYKTKSLIAVKFCQNS
jgi:hypothetical protein